MPLCGRGPGSLQTPSPSPVGAYREAVARKPNRTLWFLMATLVIGGSGCSNSRQCTLIGAESGVSVELKGVPVAQGNTVRVCVDGECNEVRVADPSAPTFVKTSQIKSERTTAVVVSAQDSKGGELIPDTEILVRPERRQPNGPGRPCGVHAKCCCLGRRLGCMQCHPAPTSGHAAVSENRQRGAELARCRPHGSPLRCRTHTARPKQPSSIVATAPALPTPSRLIGSAVRANTARASAIGYHRPTTPSPCKKAHSVKGHGDRHQGGNLRLGKVIPIRRNSAPSWEGRTSAHAASRMSCVQRQLGSPAGNVGLR